MATPESPAGQQPRERPPSEAVHGAPSRFTRPAAAIVAASIGTILAWVAVDRGYGAIPWPEMSEAYLQEAAEKYANLPSLSDEAKAEYNAKEQIFLHRNAGLVIGLFGLVMGLLFGALAGRERSAKDAVIGAIAGACIGAAFGVAGGYAGASVARIAAGVSTEATSAAELQSAWLREMYTSIAIHSAVWCIAGIGLAIVVVMFGNPARSTGRSIGMAIGAGLIAAALYTPIASVVVPGVQSGLTIPADPAARGIAAITTGAHNLALARLLFVLLPAATMSLMVLAHNEPRRRRPEPKAADAKPAPGAAAGPPSRPQ